MRSTTDRPSACAARRRSSGSGTASAASTVVSAPSNSSRSSTTARDSSRRARSSPARGSGPSTGSAAGRRRSFRHSAASPTAIPPVRNAARRFTGWTISRGRMFGARAGRSGARRGDPHAPDRASGRARSWGRPSLDRCYYGRRFLPCPPAFPNAPVARQGRLRPKEGGIRDRDALRDSAYARSGAPGGAPVGDRAAHPRAGRARRGDRRRARRLGPPQAGVRDRPQGGRRLPSADVHGRDRDARGDLARPQDHRRGHAPSGRPAKRATSPTDGGGVRPGSAGWGRGRNRRIGGGVTMANINRVVLVGNLTRDPELRHTPSGTAVCKLRIAVNTRQKDASTGEWREWEAQDGTKRQAVEIIADTVQFLGSRGEGEGGREFVPAGAAAESGADFGTSGADDDIPF